MIRQYPFSNIIIIIICLVACNKGGTEESGVPKGAVDLGLSVYWAEYNVGAETSYDSGDFYSWGEIQNKPSYSIMDYKWFDPNSFKRPDNTYLVDVKILKYNTMSKYGMVDKKTVLEPADDVAQVKLGHNWYIPTDAEWKELIDNCTCTWTTRSGVIGIEVCSNLNGNKLFLPAAGVYRWSYVLSSSTHSREGSYGHYWSSSLYLKDTPWATSLIFYKEVEDEGYKPKSEIYINTTSWARNEGLCVRPVYRK